MQSNGLSGYLLLYISNWSILTADSLILPIIAYEYTVKVVTFSITGGFCFTILSEKDMVTLGGHDSRLRNTAVHHYSLSNELHCMDYCSHASSATNVDNSVLIPIQF